MACGARSRRKKKLNLAFRLDENRVLRSPVTAGKKLGENPFFEQSVRTRWKIEKLHAGLSKTVCPANPAQSFDVNAGRHQLKTNMNLLVETQGSNRLQCDSSFAKIPDNAPIGMIQIHVCQPVNPTAVAAWFSRCSFELASLDGLSQIGQRLH